MPHHTSHRPMTDSIVDALAAKADVDPRTLIRALAGLPVRGRPGLQVARVLAGHRTPAAARGNRRRLALQPVAGKGDALNQAASGSRGVFEARKLCTPPKANKSDRFNRSARSRVRTAAQVPDAPKVAFRAAGAARRSGPRGRCAPTHKRTASARPGAASRSTFASSAWRGAPRTRAQRSEGALVSCLRRPSTCSRLPRRAPRRPQRARPRSMTTPRLSNRLAFVGWRRERRRAGSGARGGLRGRARREHGVGRPRSRLQGSRTRGVRAAPTPIQPRPQPLGRGGCHTLLRRERPPTRRLRRLARLAPDVARDDRHVAGLPCSSPQARALPA